MRTITVRVVRTDGETLTAKVQVPRTDTEWRKRYSRDWIQRALEARLVNRERCRLRYVKRPRIAQDRLGGHPMGRG